MYEASEAIGDLRKICDEVKESIDPIILSSIEALIDKTYDAIEDDNEEARTLFKETLLRGAELVEQSKHASERIVEQNLEDLLMKVSDMIDEHEHVIEFSEEVPLDTADKTPDKTDHAYSKRISKVPYPLTKQRSKSESQDVQSASSKSLERLEEGSKVIQGHGKVKKVMKSVSNLSPFIPRFSSPTNSVLTKHMFTTKSAGGAHIKTSVTSKSLVIDLVKKPVEVSKDPKIKLDVVDVGTNTEKNEKGEVKSQKTGPGKTKQPDPPNTIVTKHTQHWTVANFNKKMKMANGKSIDSMFFSINMLGKKSDWSLMLYPNGDKEKSTGFLSLYLTCRNRRGLDTAMEFKFTLLDKEGKTATSTPTKSGSISARMLATNSSWGWECFVKQQDIKNNGLIINNKLTICCDVTLKLTDPDKLKKSPHKDPVVVEDSRDIDALVDFVGEITSPKKKKGPKNKSKEVDVDALEEDEKEVDEEDTEVEEDPKREVPGQTFIENVGEEKEVELALQDLSSCDFQVVTRRRRKNSQSATSVSPTPTPTPAKDNKSKGKSRKKESPRKESARAPTKAATPSKPREKRREEKPVGRKDPVNISSLCLDTKESLAELLQTKTLLEENISRLAELAVSKTGTIKEMTRDRDTKLEVLEQHNQQLLHLRTDLEEKLQHQRKLVESLELEVEDVEAQIKRGKEKGARMKMYLDMNIVDASSELKRLGQEKEELVSRLDSVENKLRGNKQKDRLLNIHTQILRLQTNLECPICTETASSPIYQCKEGHLVCSSCVVRVARCAICRQPGPVNVRNRYAENDSQELGCLLLERDEIMASLTGSLSPSQ